jgi:hypothetical protein
MSVFNREVHLRLKELESEVRELKINVRCLRGMHKWIITTKDMKIYCEHCNAKPDTMPDTSNGQPKESSMNNEITSTERGFSIVDFTDAYGDKCSLQKSSSAESDKIWLGLNKPILSSLVIGEGWKDFQLPGGVLAFSRMHLTREQVAKLLPHLQRFVDTGDI